MSDPMLVHGSWYRMLGRTDLMMEGDYYIWATRELPIPPGWAGREARIARATVLRPLSALELLALRVD